MHIGIDVDGVLRKLLPSIVREYIKDHPEEASKFVDTDQVQDWAVDKLVRRDSSLQVDLGTYAFENPESAFRCFANADPFKGAVQDMGRLYSQAKSEGHIISICTSQPNPWQRQATAKWLDDNNVPFDNLIMSATGKGHYGLDTLFDDKVKNVEDVEQSGGVGVLKEMEYNADNYGPSASSVEEFHQVIL